MPTSAIPIPAHMKVNVTKKTEVTPAAAHIPMVGELVISVSKPIILIITIYIRVRVHVSESKEQYTCTILLKFAYCAK